MNWQEDRTLQVSDQKSAVTLFTPQTQQSHHHERVSVIGSPLSLDRNSTNLGITFDPHLYFHYYVYNIVKKTKPRLNLLRLSCSTNWAQQKETLLATFKSLIGSLFTFATQIQFPNTSETSINKLQIIQNSALRIASGCGQMTAIDHIHSEAKTLKVEEHIGLLCSQFLAVNNQPEHVFSHTQC